MASFNSKPYETHNSNNDNNNENTSRDIHDYKKKRNNKTGFRFKYNEK